MLQTRRFSLWLLAIMAAAQTEASLITYQDYPMPIFDSDNFDETKTYSPINFATVSSLDLDLRSIVAYASVDTQDGLESAQNIFQKGTFSDSYASLQIVDPTGKFSTTETNILPGAQVIGQTASGQTITGIAKLGKIEVLNGSASSPVLQVFYRTVALEDTNNGCFVGGNPTPLTDGCFAPSGRITITGFGYTYEFDYTYNPMSDNFNGLSLASLDRLRGKSKISGFVPKTNRKFMNYYGFNLYYDQEWIVAAFEGTSTAFEGTPTATTNGAMDFGEFGVAGRAAAVRTGIVTLRMWYFVMNSIDDAVTKCQLNEAGEVDRWDHAFAAFSGSIPTQTPAVDYSLGYFLYTLAQTECKFFGTCDPTTGVAKVNQDALKAFTMGKEALMKSDCDGAEENARRLQSLLAVPLIQGLLRNSHTLDVPQIIMERIQGETAAFAAPLLPLLHDCSPGFAFSVYDSIKPGRAVTSSFEVIKDAVEQTYDCLGVTCEQVGGLRNTGGDGWISGAEPCGIPVFTMPPISLPEDNDEDNDDNRYWGADYDDNNSKLPSEDDDDYNSFATSTKKNRDDFIDNNYRGMIIGIFVGITVVMLLIAVVVGIKDSKHKTELAQAVGAAEDAGDAAANEDEEIAVGADTPAIV